MADQILALHRTSQRIYDLTGLRTGSVRDQLLRANLLSHALYDIGEITTSQPLLIIGAGAAGMCAALTAAERGTHVTILEEGLHPFWTFFKSTLRRIDPVEYDWPHDHYQLGRFPMTPGYFPLQQATATGADLARDWTRVWLTWLKSRNGVGHRGTIDLKNSTNGRSHFNSASLINNEIEVTGVWDLGQPASTMSFGAIINAAGFIKEVTDSNGKSPDPWNAYCGPQFWTDDDGITEDRTKKLPFKKVVISGGGDGAMQDLQRLITGDFGKNLLSEFLYVAKKLSVHLDTVKMERNILAIENKSQREYAWQRKKFPAVSLMAEWHADYNKLVVDFLRPINRALARTIIARLFRSEFVDRSLEIYWVYRDKTPGYVYALNRFLTSIIVGLVHKAHSPRLSLFIYPESYIDDIQTGTHVCGIPTGCVGSTHDISIAQNSWLSTPLKAVDLILIRHGAHLAPGKSAPIPDQMVPFDIPN